MKRLRRKHESTAYHEAGHAVAAVVLRLSMNKLGTAHVLCRLRDNPEWAGGAETQRGLEQKAIMRFAGDAAERTVSNVTVLVGIKTSSARQISCRPSRGSSTTPEIEVARIGASSICVLAEVARKVDPCIECMFLGLAQSGT